MGLAAPLGPGAALQTVRAGGRLRMRISACGSDQMVKVGRLALPPAMGFLLLRSSASRNVSPSAIPVKIILPHFFIQLLSQIHGKKSF